MTLDGTPPREILTEFLRQVGRHGRSVAWHPDSKRISVWASDPHKTSLDFWTVPLSGTEPLKSEVAPAVVELLKSVSFEDGGPSGEFLWAPSGRAVYFEGTTRGVQNLWKATVDPRTLRWLSLERVTTGPGSDTDFEVSPDGRKLAFTVRDEPTRIMSYEFDAGAGRISGGGQPLSPFGVSAWMPDLSRDGKRLVFTTERNGKQELWEKSLSDGREARLFADDYTRKEPRWSPDGTRLEYLRFKPGSCQYILLRENGSDEEVLASDSTCESRPYDWSRDGKWVVSAVYSNKSEPQGNASAAWLLPISAAPHAEARRRLLMKGGQYGIYQMRFSPDGRSIVFEAVNLWGATNATLWVVPTSGGQWIPITDGKSWDDKPRWSPDGKAIYFISSRSGFLNVWGIRFDPVTQVPLGDPFRVTAFESPAQGVPERMTPLGMSLTENRLVLPISEASGSIWMLEDVNP